jgi:hypothetical protein
MMQLTGREPLYLDILTQGALLAFPYGLRNAAQTVEHLWCDAFIYHS